MSDFIWSISTITSKDLIEIKSTLHVLSVDEFSCIKCKAHRLFEKKKIVKSCVTPSEKPKFILPYQGVEIKYFKCVGNYFSFSAMEYIRLYEPFEKGCLPFPGSTGEQPNKILELFKHVAIYKGEEHDKQMQKLKNRRR